MNPLNLEDYVSERLEREKILFYKKSSKKDIINPIVIFLDILESSWFMLLRIYVYFMFIKHVLLGTKVSSTFSSDQNCKLIFKDHLKVH